MTILDIIPDLSFAVTITEARIEGGTFDPLDETPSEFRFAYSSDVTKPESRVQIRVTGDVTITKARIEAEHSGRAYSTIPPVTLARYIKKLLRLEIKAQIQELVKKETAP